MFTFLCFEYFIFAREECTLCRGFLPGNTASTTFAVQICTACCGRNPTINLSLNSVNSHLKFCTTYSECPSQSISLRWSTRTILIKAPPYPKTNFLKAVPARKRGQGLKVRARFFQSVYASWQAWRCLMNLSAVGIEGKRWRPWTQVHWCLVFDYNRTTPRLKR